jgi:hypothetical protein
MTWYDNALLKISIRVSFGRGAPKSTTQGVILTTLPLATFQLFNSTSIDEYRWREQVIPHRMMVASL